MSCSLRNYWLVPIGLLPFMCGCICPAKADSARFSLPVTHVPSTIYSAKLKDTAEANRPMTLTIVLPLRNQEDLESTIQKLSSPQYRQHHNFLTPQEFASQYGPTAADTSAVSAFARANGMTIKHVSGSGTSVEVTGTATNVETAFNVKINDYVGSDGRTFFAPDREPTVTADVSEKVLSVLGLDNSAKVAHAISGTGVPVNNQPEFSPNDIRNIYNIPLSSTCNGAGRTLGLVECDTFSPTDIAVYDAGYKITGAQPVAVSVDGFNTGSASWGGRSEVTLDIDMMSALAPAANNILVYEDGNNIVNGSNSISAITAMDLYKIYQAIAEANAVDVVSTSWYVTEDSYNQSLISAENQIFLQIAAEGMSMFAASGDDGVYGNGDANPATIEDPADQPYLTAVGGTSLTDTNSETYGSEAAWCDGPLYASGGGYAQYSPWSIPWYQDIAFNSTRSGGGQSYLLRNVPDVSLCAAVPGNEGPYSVYLNGTWQGWGGTSAAAPLWAAFTALLDQQQGSRLGLLNPYLYRIAENPTAYSYDFHDVTTVSNTSESSLIFPVVTGYDDATGWGSFNGANLLSDFAKYGKVAPYTPQAIAVASDGAAYILWNGYGDDGSAAVMSVNSAGVLCGAPTFGPDADWDATSMAAGSDGLQRVLWVYQGTSMTYWMVSGDNVSKHPETSLAGFKPMSISATGTGASEVVWWNPTTNGVQCWSINGSIYTSFLNYTSSPISNPTVVTGAADANGNTYILWSQTGNASGGLVAIYSFNSAGALTYAPTPTSIGSGWTAKSITVGLDNVARILLSDASGDYAYWTYTAGGTLWKSEVFPAVSNWASCGIAGDSSGSTYILGKDTSDIWYANFLVGTGNSMPSPSSTPIYYGY